MAVNKVEYGGSTLIDLTSDTVTADNLLSGYTAHDKSGTLITGTYNPFKPQIIVVTENNNYVRATALRGGTVLSGRATGGAYVFDLPSYDTWEIEASLNSSFAQSQSTVVIVNTVKQYVVKLSVVPDFSAASWSNIQYAAKNGLAADYWQVGDTKTYQDTSGNTRTVEIVDIGDSSMVLDLADLYASGARAFNWPNDTFLPSLPQDFKSVVTSAAYFSWSEIFGASPLKLFSTASGRSKGVSWWTSTQAYGNYYYYVTASGTQSSDLETNSHYHNAKITIS